MRSAPSLRSSSKVRAGDVQLEQIGDDADVGGADHAHHGGQGVERMDKLEGPIFAQVGIGLDGDTELHFLFGEDFAHFGQTAAMEFEVFVIGTQIVGRGDGDDGAGKAEIGGEGQQFVDGGTAGFINIVVFVPNPRETERAEFQVCAVDETAGVRKAVTFDDLLKFDEIDIEPFETVGKG